MTVQIIIFIISILAYSYCKDVGSRKDVLSQRKRYITIIMVMFALQSCLRNVAIGPDTYRYFERFEIARLESWNVLLQNMEDYIYLGIGKDPGFDILEKAFATVIPNYRLFLIAVAVFFFYSLGKFFYRFAFSNEAVLISVPLYQCIYYNFFSITGIRQTIATGILFFAVPLALERKAMKFLLCVLLAATQHMTALLFLLLYPLVYVRNIKISFIIYFILFIPMFTIVPLITEYMVNGSVYLNKYSMFVEQSEGAGAYALTAYMILANVCVFSVIKRLMNFSNSYYLLINAFALGLLLTPLTMIDQSNVRVMQYFSVFGLIVFPTSLLLITNKQTNGRISDVSFVIYFIIAAYTLSKGMDYAFFWQDVPLGNNYEEGGRLVNDFTLNIL